MRDDKKESLDRAEWRGRLEAERPDLAPLFDRLIALRKANEPMMVAKRGV
jgi:hypothetical protein